MSHLSEPPRLEDFGYRPGPDGTWLPSEPVVHRDEEYDEASFDALLNMQTRHFWYRGRHRFLLAAVREQLRQTGRATGGLRAIDLGGGCGGWVRYLQEHAANTFAELALADSSRRALSLAAPVVGPDVRRYQVDLLHLGWVDRWDVAFALDVLEHIPDASAAMRQIGQVLAPGGLLFVTLPALRFFWSAYDVMVGHQRRYARADLEELAQGSGLRLRKARYFMFFLSPLVLLSRLRRPNVERMTVEEVRRHLAHAHRLPPAPLNGLLSLIFAAETPLGLRLSFPWGTSVLGVFEKER